jgi:hypothetical protein
MTRKYKLDEDKRYVYDNETKKICEYDKKRDPQSEVINLVWDAILKDLKKRNTDLSQYGIAMVQ